MKKQLVATICIIFVPFLFASCVSSLLKDKPPSFSHEIKLVAPGKPFVKTDTSIYPSWKNTITGNVISVVSDCNENSTYKLSHLHQLLEDSLENIIVIKEESTLFQKKPALSRIIQAKLDEQPIEIYSVSFKRKSCGYIAAYSGKINGLEADKFQFEKFINDFGFE